MSKHNTDDLDEVWDILESAHVGFLTTRHGADLHARPMGLYPRRDDGLIYMLTDASSFKDDAIAHDPHVGVSVQDGGKYLSIAAEGHVSNDREKIRELWSTAAEAWWDGPDDPQVRLLTLLPKDAHYWRTPGKAVAMIAMTAAAVTGRKNPDLGEEGEVRMN